MRITLYLGVMLASLATASAGTLPYCMSLPHKDEAAIEACNYFIDNNSDFAECLEMMTKEQAKDIFQYCQVAFCKSGPDGVCTVFEQKKTFCEETYEVEINDGPPGCVVTTTTPVITTPAPNCDHPGLDEEAIEACAWVIDSACSFHECTKTFDLETLKDKFLHCTQLFCSGGMAAVCEYVEELREKCKPIIVDTVVPGCDVTTTTAEPSVCTPTQAEHAVEVCDFVLDSNSEYFGCTDSMDAGMIKSWLRNCTETYCIGGMDSLCDVANRLAHACEAYGYGVITQRPPGCICSLLYLDIIIVVDTSLSVDEVELGKMKNFVKEVATAFDISDSTSRVGIINYADDVNVEVDLASSNSNPEITQIALSMQRRPCFGACTWTPAGLDEMSQMFLAQGSTSPKVGILLTDGFSNIGNLQNAVSNIPSDVTMFAVGAVEASHQQLLDIAGDVSRVFEVKDFDGLATIIQSLKTEICV